jgi:hypothetical protein
MVGVKMEKKSELKNLFNIPEQISVIRKAKAPVKTNNL